MPARSHGRSHDYLHNIWGHIVQRCTNPNNKRYADYGGRGILMCVEWRNNFEAFATYVGERPSPKHSLDRIDNDKGYEPGNVRWADDVQQAGNSRRAKLITHGGKTQPIGAWCRDIGLSYNTYKQRIRAGWDPVRAATTPPDLKRRRRDYD